MDSLLLSNVTNDILVVDFQQTEILDQHAVDTVGQELKNLVADSQCSKVLLDMNRIELLTSAMIGQFVLLHKESRARGADLRFCNLTSEINELFRITKLDIFFELHESREEAMQAFVE